MAFSQWFDHPWAFINELFGLRFDTLFETFIKYWMKKDVLPRASNLRRVFSGGWPLNKGKYLDNLCYEHITTSWCSIFSIYLIKNHETGSVGWDHISIGPISRLDSGGSAWVDQDGQREKRAENGNWGTTHRECSHHGSTRKISRNQFQSSWVATKSTRNNRWSGRHINSQEGIPNWGGVLTVVSSPPSLRRDLRLVAARKQLRKSSPLIVTGSGKTRTSAEIAFARSPCCRGAPKSPPPSPETPPTWRYPNPCPSTAAAPSRLAAPPSDRRRRRRPRGYCPSPRGWVCTCWSWSSDFGRPAGTGAPAVWPPRGPADWRVPKDSSSISRRSPRQRRPPLWPAPSCAIAPAGRERQTATEYAERERERGSSIRRWEMRKGGGRERKRGGRG